MTHHFRPGQTVRLTRSRAIAAAPEGEYEILRVALNARGVATARGGRLLKISPRLPSLGRA
jgi:hypothetical protein